MLPIGGRPLLEIWLDHLTDHGVGEVLVNTHHLADQVEAFVRHRIGGPDLRLEYEETLLGSGGTIHAFRDFVAQEPAFWVIYGDNLSTVDLTEMASVHERSGRLATVGLFEAEDPRACGIASLDESGRITAFEEKPPHPKGNLANGGIYMLNAAIFDEVRWEFPFPIDFGYHILPQLVGRMQGYRIHGLHMDIGTPESYAKAQKIYSCMETELC